MHEQQTQPLCSPVFIGLLRRLLLTPGAPRCERMADQLTRALHALTEPTSEARLALVVQRGRQLRDDLAAGVDECRRQLGGVRVRHQVRTRGVTGAPVM
jgi:hypothetical protein